MKDDRSVKRGESGERIFSLAAVRVKRESSSMVVEAVADCGVLIYHRCRFKANHIVERERERESSLVVIVVDRWWWWTDCGGGASCLERNYEV